MKSNINNHPPVFTPFTLNIYIETPEELISLWHRMNNNSGKGGNVRMDDLWCLLNSAAKDRGIKVRV